MYHLTATTIGDAPTLDTAVDTADAALDALDAYLHQHLTSGPIRWSIASPWRLTHRGDIDLHGRIEARDDTISQHLARVRDNLAHEAAHPHDDAAADVEHPALIG